METRLTKRCGYQNTMMAGNKEIGEVRFFDPSTQTEICHVKWFSKSDSSNNSYPVIALPFEVQLKRKWSLSLNYAFFVSMGNNVYDLYIPNTLVNIVELKPTSETFKHGDIMHYRNFGLHLNCSVDEGPVTLREVRIKMYTDSERSEHGKELDHWEKELGDKGINISGYNLERLLEDYVLVKKLIGKAKF